MPKDSRQEDEIKQGKFFAVIAYWIFLCVLSLLLKKDNKFALYHGKQGLVLFIFLAAGFMFNILPLLGQYAYRLILLVYLVLSLWGMVQALRGKYARIPLVSRIAEKIIL
jgi:uncharacterized membrane protein